MHEPVGKQVNKQRQGSIEVVNHAIYDCCILIVDDDLTSLILLEQILSAKGFSNLHFADDGLKGLQQLEDIQPDLILLDWVMPNMNGHEFCRKARSLEAYKDVPILVQTGQEATQHRIDAFEVGASDFVTKPLLGEEILARIRMHLSNRVLIKQLSGYSERVKSELISARRMQNELIPDDADVAVLGQRYGMDIAHFYQASNELGGDYYGFIPIDDNRLAFYMGDFAGHGVTAAINTFRMQILIPQEQANIDDPTRFLTSLNDRLQSFLSVGQFSTLLYGIVDCRNWTLHYATAAAPKPLLLTGGETNILGSEGTPIGISQTLFDVEDYCINLPEHGTLIFHSDALIEEKGIDGTFFGRERLLGLLDHGSSALDAQGHITQMVGTLSEHADGQLFSDDLTILVMGFKR